MNNLELVMQVLTNGYSNIHLNDNNEICCYHENQNGTFYIEAVFNVKIKNVQEFMALGQNKEIISRVEGLLKLEAKIEHLLEKKENAEEEILNKFLHKFK